MLKRFRRPAKPAAPKAVAQVASQAASQEYRKPRADVYTILLVIALLIIVLATVALWMTMKDNDYMYKGGPPMPAWHRPAPATTLDAPYGIA